MTNRAMSSILLAASVLVNATLASAETLKTGVNPGRPMHTPQLDYSETTSVSPNTNDIHVAGQIGITNDGPNDFESQVARSFNNLISVVEAQGGGIEDIVKITLLVKYNDEKEPRYLVQTVPGSWRAYRRTR
jgi:enamine deaminase RidA (YjgF/YER057c/UK114 family)